MADELVDVRCEQIPVDNLTREECMDGDLFQKLVFNLTGDNTTLAIRSCLDECELVECTSNGETTTADILYTVFVQVFVFMLVFGLAGSVDFTHFKERFRSRGVYIGLLCQFVLMPLIGFMTVAMFNEAIKPLYAVILLIICASPGGSYSNWWCNLINADLALSVAMTTVSTVISAGILPLNIILYIEVGYKNLSPENAQEVVKFLPYDVIGYTLAVVISAVILGLLFGYHYPQHMKPVNLGGTIAGFVSIGMGVFASSNSCALPWDQDPILYVAILVPVILGLAISMLFATLARLPKPQRVAVSIETAYQNTGIALAVSLSLGAQGRAAAVVPVVYGGYEAVIFGLYSLSCWYVGWTLSPSDENLCVILFNDYQDTIEDHKHYKGYGKSKGLVDAEMVQQAEPVQLDTKHTESL